MAAPVCCTPVAAGPLDDAAALDCAAPQGISHFNPVVSLVDWLLGRTSGTVMFDRHAIETATKERLSIGHLIANPAVTIGRVSQASHPAPSHRSWPPRSSEPWLASPWPSISVPTGSLQQTDPGADVNESAVLFLCTHNAGRSQMAMGFFKQLAGARAAAYPEDPNLPTKSIPPPSRRCSRRSSTFPPSSRPAGHRTCSWSSTW